MQSLADELNGEFEDVDLNLADSLETMETSNESNEEIAERTRRIESVVLEEHRHLEPMETSYESNEEIVERTRRIESMVLEEHQYPIATPSPSTSPTIAGSDSDSPATSVDDNTASTTLGQLPKKSIFIEHLRPVESASQKMSEKEHTKMLASMYNRELIDRNADGFFNIETMPTVAADVHRRVQQSQGIATLQGTLVPPPLSDTASSSSVISHASSSTAVDPVKHPSRLRQATSADPKCRFSLGRDLIAAGHQKRISKPSAPTRFVRMPTDPIVNFQRKFGEAGLKVIVPRSELDEGIKGDSGSIASVEHATTVPNGKPKLEFGVPRKFMPDQCLESSCPIRFAHAKGPYHHRGQRHNKIMTGLFGHSNPPPEIWNAYRNMVHLTSDGEMLSPDGRPSSTADDDLVIAFAIFHYGELNSMGGEEFHRRYAGKHLFSRIALQSSAQKSLAGVA